MKKPIWLLALIGVVLGVFIGILQNHQSHDPLEELFPAEKLKDAVADVRVGILGNLTAKSIMGGDILLARAITPRPLQPSEISSTVLNILRGILRQNKADWICVYLADDSILAATSNWTAVAEYHRGKITLMGGLPTSSQLDSVRASGLSILRPDSVQSRLVGEVFDSLRIKSDRWKVSQTLRDASAASMDRGEFFRLELDTRELFNIGKKHAMTGDQVRVLVLSVTRYYWLNAGKVLEP